MPWDVNCRCRWCVSHATEWGVDLYVGLQFFQSRSQGVSLYAGTVYTVGASGQWMDDHKM